MSKKCAQLVGTRGQNAVGEHAHEHAVYTQRVIPGHVVHYFVHMKTKVFRVFTTMLYTGKNDEFNLVGTWFSALSTRPTTITTTLINK